jgi:hypothetical protein
MAFDPSALHRLDFMGRVGNGPGSVKYRYNYATLDTAAAVEAANYFNGAVQELAVGASIDAVMVLGGTPVRKAYVVTANSGTAVTIALATATAG